MKEPGSIWLAVGGIGSAAISLLHLAMIPIGGPAYRYFGAGERFAQRAEAGSLQPPVLTFAIALVFVVFADYAFAGGGWVRRRPPLLRAGLVAIATIYLLRGLLVIPQAISLALEPGRMPFRYVMSSVVSLLLGVCYAAGTWAVWKLLKKSA